MLEEVVRVVGERPRDIEQSFISILQLLDMFVCQTNWPIGLQPLSNFPPSQQDYFHTSANPPFSDHHQIDRPITILATINLDDPYHPLGSSQCSKLAVDENFELRRCVYF